VQFYTPKDTVRAEAAIRAALLQVMDGNLYDKECPLHLEATFFLLRPSSLPKRIQLPVKKPDFDNLIKTLTDALEKFVYANDSQITSANIRKRFGSPPRIELFLKEDKL
jgi:Holliday junction resolvase RusA-like endonuclease